MWRSVSPKRTAGVEEGRWGREREDGREIKTKDNQVQIKMISAGGGGWRGGGGSGGGGDLNESAAAKPQQRIRTG